MGSVYFFAPGNKIVIPLAFICGGKMFFMIGVFLKMDTGLAHLISSIVTGVASIIAAIIAGFYAVRTAEAKTKPLDAKPPLKNDGKEALEIAKRERPKRNKSVGIIFYALVMGLVSMFVGFFIAYAGNSLFGSEAFYYDPFSDSIDPAIVSGLLGFLAFLIGYKFIRYKEVVDCPS